MQLESKLEELINSVENLYRARLKMKSDTNSIDFKSAANKSTRRLEIAPFTPKLDIRKRRSNLKSSSPPVRILFIYYYYHNWTKNI